MLVRILNRLHINAAIALTAIILMISGCGGGGSSSGPDQSDFTFGGSVGDGPVVSAMITVEDAFGDVISSQQGDDFANYQITLSTLPTFPLVITATGGTDLVTDAQPTFEMKSVVMGSSQNTANINPFSTLIVNTAQNMSGGLSASNLATAKSTMLDQLGFGLDTQAIADTITTGVGEQNVANIVKASEVLAEMIRRTRQTLLVAGINHSEDTIISKMSADLTDGVLDGIGTGNADAHIAAAANIVSAQVLLEAMVNKLQVDGANAAPRMDSAIGTTMPSASSSTGDVRINSAMISQAKTAVAAAQAIAPSAALTSIATSLDNLTANSLPGAVESQIPKTSGGNLNQALLDVATATNSELEAVNAAVRDGGSNNGGGNSSDPLSITDTMPASYEWDTIDTGAFVYIDRSYTFTSIPAQYMGLDYLQTANDDKTSNANPLISFDVSEAVEVYVAHVTDSSNRPSWLASWSVTGDVVVNTDRTLYVYSKQFPAGTVTLGDNGGALSMYSVMVGGQGGGGSNPAPTVTFVPDSFSLAYNGSTALSWAAANATSCSASGGWSGTKAINGSETVGPLTVDTSYTITCTGDGGQTTETVNISVGSPPADTPTVSLSASPTFVQSGETTVLSWNSTNVDNCTASGANGWTSWSGSKGTSGSITSAPLTTDTTFTLDCTGANGSASQSVTVTVTAPPPAPSVTLTATPNPVAFNNSTILTWTTENVDSCVASDGWAGGKTNTGGSASSNALQADTTFTIECTGPGGTATDSVTVSVLIGTGTATLSWTPPTTNEDGSVLDDLAGYKIYHGTSSGNYSNPTVVNNPGISSYVVDSLLPGTHYFVIAAFDTSGNESGYSNEASKTIN